MSNIKVETTEPDPAATSFPNDEMINKEGGDPSAPTDKETIVADAKSKETNGKVEAEEKQMKEENRYLKEVKDEKNEEKTDEKTEEKTEENGTTQKKNPRTYENGVLKTSGQVQEGRGVKNSKYDPSILPTTDDPSKIRAQVEFYFSDANLPTDKYLWELTDGANNLPVSIGKICQFGRMKRFQPVSAVVAALKESHFLEVTGPEGEEKINRKDAYNPLAPRSKAEARSVYVKGFGDEEPSSQFDIEAFFAPYGPTNAVRLRRTQEKLFKGSVFVEFVDEETAQKFLGLEPKPLWKGKHPLIIQSKKSYTDQKEQEIKDGKVEPAETWGRGRGKPWGRGRGGNRGDRGHYRNDREGRGRGDARGDRDPDDWKKRREEDRASGFKDNHRRNERGRRDGGDRKGRGGRRDRDDRGPRSGDRNRDREEKDNETKDEPTEKIGNEKKRPREEDEAGDEKPTKKVESKSDEAPAVETEKSPAQNEKKRAREDDGADEAPAKKIDTKSEVALEGS